jgi:hypothetical protein
MEYPAAVRSMRAVATLTTVGALALAPVAAAPPALHTPGVAAARISTEAVQLTDVWSELLTDTVTSAVKLGEVFVGTSSAYPLMSPVFVAPIAAQLVINPLIYAVQLFTGQRAQIPVEINNHLNNILTFGNAVLTDIPPAIVKQIQTPFQAAQLAVESVATATNKLIALLEAPAVFLNAALNSQYGLIGINGPIAVPFVVRNELANAIYTAPPAVLPLKKAAAAVSIPKTAATAVVPKSVTASSARSKTKPPSSAHSGRKSASAKADSKGSGARSKRG